jgi:predicted HTH domain antitoxin
VGAVIFQYGNHRRKVAIRTYESRKFGGERLSQEVARLLPLEFYREDKVSLGRAAGLCLKPWAAFMDFAARHGVPLLRYSFEDMKEERQTAGRLKA